MQYKTKNNVYINATMIYILANGIGQGLALLSNIFFTRFMSKMDYGLYTNYYSYVSIFASIVGANLYVGLSNAYIDYKKDIYKFRSSVLCLSVLIFGVVSIVTVTIGYVLDISMPMICVAFALIHAYGFFLVNYYMESMNMENQYIKKGIFLCLPNVLQIVLSAIALVIINTYESRILGSSIGVFICGLICFIAISSKEKLTVNYEYWKYALKISLPAIISSVSYMIMQQCDKVMITSFYSAEKTAVYGLTYNIGYLLYAVLQATSGAWQSWYYNILKEKKYEKTHKVQKWYIIFMFFLATGLFMVAPEIIKMLSPRSYWEFEYVTPFIIGSFVMFMYNFHISTAQYNKKTGVISIIVSTAAILNIILNYILIPIYGGVGAAYTSVVSYVFIFIVSGMFIATKKQYFFNLKYFLIAFLGLAIEAGVYTLLMEKIVARYIVFMALLANQVFFCISKRNEIRDLIKKG